MKLSLVSAKFPQMLANLSHSNQFLKLFSVLVLLTNIIAWCAVIYLKNQAPLVLMLDNQAVPQKVLGQLPAPDLEIKQAISRYIEFRYNWNAKNVNEQISRTEDFVALQSLKAFRVALAGVIRFASEKQVAQKVYPEKMIVNLTKQTVSLKGDRIATIQGLKAAGEIGLTLNFESGLRTSANPWGIYITKEIEELK